VRSALVIAFVAALTLLILFGPQPGSAPARAVAAPEPPPQFAKRIPFDANQQIFNEDLAVGAGEVLTGDTVVYSGDVQVEEEGTIQGNLIVYSGDIEIERGGIVAGDVTAFSGDVDVAGRVEGDLASASGDVSLAETAWIGGDVSVLAGDIDRESGAEVHGNLVHGPNFRNVLPGLVAVPGFPENVPAADGERGMNVPPEAPGRPETWGQRLGWFILSLIGATVFTIAATLITGLVTAVWPQYVEKIEGIGRKQLPLSFAVGLLANFSLLFLTGILVVLICTIPFALALVLAMVAINVVGWTALASAVGKRVTSGSQGNLQPAVRVAVGALILTTPLAFLYAFGGCFRFMAVLLLFLLASGGAGAVMQDLLRQLSERNKRRQSGRGNGSAGGPAPQPSAPPTDSGQAAAPAEAPFVEPEMGAAALTDPLVDDFTRIHGVNLEMDRQLKEAGINTFAQLAGLTPAAIGEIIGWTPDQVESQNITGQAATLAEMP
jgi:predicted flap endonuclease-1-like 5' DNA nuclease/cytoskeletal protein CcmA (bactofilin family)